ISPRLRLARKTATERRQPLVPGGSNRDHPFDRVLERRRRHLVARLATGARRPQQARFRQRGELLRDGLAGDRELGRELRRGRRAARRHRLDERASARITQCGEDAVYAAASAVHAIARSSNAGANSGEDSTTRTSVPASTVSSSVATLAPAS